MQMNQASTSSPWNGSDDGVDVVTGHIVSGASHDFKVDECSATGSGDDVAVCGVKPSASEDDKVLGVTQFTLQSWKDTWAAALFLVMIGTDVVWCAMAVGNSLELFSIENLEDFVDLSLLDELTTEEFLGTLALGILYGVFLAWSTIVLLQAMPRELVILNNTLIAALLLALGLSLFQGGNVNNAAFIFMLGIAQLFLFFRMRGFISYSAKLLSAAAAVVGQYHRLFFVAVLQLALFLPFLALNLLAVIPAALRALNEEEVLPLSDAFVPVALFSIIFVACVMAEMLSLTTAGVVTTWCFSDSYNMPNAPVWESFKRASTRSFGSVCVGSFANSLMWVIAFVCYPTRIFFNYLPLIIWGFVKDILSSFNSYVLMYAVANRCSYMESLRRAWRLYYENHQATSVNDLLTMYTLHWMGILLSCATAVLAWTVTRSVVVTSIVFAISLVTLGVTLHVLLSTMKVIVVCIVEQPDELAASSQELRAMLMAYEGDASKLPFPQDKNIDV